MDPRNHKLKEIEMKRTLKLSVLMLLTTTMLSGCIWWGDGRGGGHEGDRGGGRGGEFRGDHGGDHDERR